MLNKPPVFLKISIDFQIVYGYTRTELWLSIYFMDKKFFLIRINYGNVQIDLKIYIFPVSTVNSVSVLKFKIEFDV